MKVNKNKSNIDQEMKTKAHTNAPEIRCVPRSRPQDAQKGEESKQINLKPNAKKITGSKKTEECQ